LPSVHSPLTWAVVFTTATGRTTRTGVMDELASIIWRARRTKGHSQAAAARVVGVSQGSWAQWEHGGGVDLKNVPRLAKYLGLSEAELVRLLDQRVAADRGDQVAAGDNQRLTYLEERERDLDRRLATLQGELAAVQRMLTDLLRRAR
jgi:transcriptional regulator with XRE-family HTH domain